MSFHMGTLEREREGGRWSERERGGKRERSTHYTVENYDN